MTRSWEPLARPLLFDAVTVLGSLAAACLMPFAGLAVAAGLTLPRGRAVATLAGGWALNQAIGYGLLGYPADRPTILRGIATGLCALAALFIGTALGRGWRAAPARLLLAFAGGWIGYEALLYGADALLGGTWTFAPRFLWLIARNDLAWFAVLIAIDLAIVAGRRRAVPAFG